MEMNLILHKTEPVWFHTKTRFDTEGTRKWPINIKCVQTWPCKLLSRRRFKDESYQPLKDKLLNMRLGMNVNMFVSKYYVNPNKLDISCQIVSKACPRQFPCLPLK